jgi:hypothetical protein
MITAWTVGPSRISQRVDSFGSLMVSVQDARNVRGTELMFV